jgi:hypothetical protein
MKKDQANPKEAGKKLQSKPERSPDAELGAEQSDLNSDLLGLNGGQKPRLGAKDIQTVQRQAMAKHVGLLFGNRHLQKVVDAARGEKALGVQRQDDVPGINFEEVLAKEIDLSRRRRDKADITSPAFRLSWRTLLLLENMDHEPFESMDEVDDFIDGSRIFALSESKTIDNLPQGKKIVEIFPEAFPEHWADKVKARLKIQLDAGDLKRLQSTALFELIETMKRVPDGLLEKGFPLSFEQIQSASKFELDPSHANLNEDHVVRDAARQIRLYQMAVIGTKSIPRWNKFVDSLAKEIRSGKKQVDAEAVKLTEQLLSSKDPKALVQSDSYQDYEKLDWYFDSLHQDARGYALILGGQTLFDHAASWGKGKTQFNLQKKFANMRLAGESRTSKLKKAIKWAIEKGYIKGAARQHWEALLDNLGEVLLKAILTVGAIAVVQFIPFLNVVADAYLFAKFGKAAIDGAIEIVSLFNAIFGASSVFKLQKASARLATGSVAGIRFIVEYFIGKGAKAGGKKLKKKVEDRKARKEKQKQKDLDQQGDSATSGGKTSSTKGGKTTKTEVVHKEPIGGGHTIGITKDGRIIICTRCSELRSGYKHELDRRPDLKRQLTRAEKLENPRAKAKKAKEIHEKLIKQRKKRRGKITTAEITYLRSRTPNDKMQNQVNKVSGQKKDPFYGDKVDTLEADHIVAFDRIVKMKGFNRLSLTEQLDILNYQKNFIGIGRSTNGSLGNKRYADWNGIDGRPLNRKGRELLKKVRRQEKTLEKEIKALIKKRLDAYSKGN